MIVALNLSLLRHDIYVYNFSLSVSMYENICTKLDRPLKGFIYVMIFILREVFLIHNNLVTQISYFKIIDQSRKWRSVFYIWRRMCGNFIKYLINFLVQTSFSSMLVENDHNLIEAKMFLMYAIITEKSLQRLMLCYMNICSILYWAFFIYEDKIKYFFLSFKK